MNCQNCGKCCKHIAMQIDTPEDNDDYNNILWYLLHDKVSIYIDEGDWHIEFQTKCKKLGENNMCTYYKERPLICRTYSADECVNNAEGKPYDFEFKSAEDFLNYLKLKGITLKRETSE